MFNTYSVYCPNVTYFDEKDIKATLIENGFTLKGNIKFFDRMNKTDPRFKYRTATMVIVPYTKLSKKKVERFLKTGKMVYLDTPTEVCSNYKLCFCLNRNVKNEKYKKQTNNYSTKTDVEDYNSDSDVINQDVINQNNKISNEEIDVLLDFEDDNYNDCNRSNYLINEDLRLLNDCFVMQVWCYEI